MGSHGPADRGGVRRDLKRPTTRDVKTASVVEGWGKCLARACRIAMPWSQYSPGNSATSTRKLPKAMVSGRSEKKARRNLETQSPMAQSPDLARDRCMFELVSVFVLPVWPMLERSAHVGRGTRSNERKLGREVPTASVLACPDAPQPLARYLGGKFKIKNCSVVFSCVGKKEIIEN